jgi:hypothetical protein
MGKFLAKKKLGKYLWNWGKCYDHKYLLWYQAEVLEVWCRWPDSYRDGDDNAPLKYRS